MFKNIVPDDGAAIQAIVAFIITFAVFSLIMLRAWHMRLDDSDKMSRLPLEGDSENHHSNN